MDYEDDTVKNEPLVESTEAAKKKKQKKNEKCKICGSKDHRKMDCGMLSEERRKELQELFHMKVDRKGKGTGRKKNKNKNVNEEKLPFENDEEVNKENDLKDNGNEKGGTEFKVAASKSKPSNKFKHNKERHEKKDKSGAVVEKGE